MKKVLLNLLAAASATLLGTAWLASKVIRRSRSNYYDTLPVFKLRNKQGVEVHISPVGAAIIKLIVPDAKGNRKDIVLGYERAEDYVTKDPVTYFGVLVGRVANRIAKATFTLDGQQYDLLANNGPNALHGGALGLHKRVWNYVDVTNSSEYTQVTLDYDSPSGEEGYPGHLHVTVSYRLALERNELVCDIRAITDEATPVNIAQHSYFNLAGHNSEQSILNHVMHIPSGDHYTPVDDTLIPTGAITAVKGTPFDFTQPHAIGERIDQVPGGYDHNYVLFNQGPQAKFITKQGVASERPKLAATVCEPTSGRCMDVLTTAPGMQFYSGNFLDTSVTGKDKTTYFKHAGFCLETQGFPDSINQPTFPSVVLQPTETYTHQVVYKFYTK